MTFFEALKKIWLYWFPEPTPEQKEFQRVLKEETQKAYHVNYIKESMEQAKAKAIRDAENKWAPKNKGMPQMTQESKDIIFGKNEKSNTDINKILNDL